MAANSQLILVVVIISVLVTRKEDTIRNVLLHVIDTQSIVNDFLVFDPPPTLCV
jgi:hypothetical protein